MRVGPLYLGLVCLIFSALPVQAVDLTKIERTIAKEPKYEGKPKYCLLVFGPEAKLRVWLVLDGQVLYVDRNGNGDLTEPDERVLAKYKQNEQDFGFRPGQFVMTDGKAKYRLALVRFDADGCDLEVRLENGGYARAGFDGPGRLRLADSAKDAPIIHFLGPMTLQRFEPQPCSVSQNLKPEPLVRGQETRLAFSVGTPGLGSGTFAKYPYPETSGAATAEIRFADGRTISASLVPDG